jgi:hypothetical protein
MRHIFDNIEDKFPPLLQETLSLSDRADFCVGYFNLRGWKVLDSHIERWFGGTWSCCRLLVGMQRIPQEGIHALLGLTKGGEEIDNRFQVEKWDCAPISEHKPLLRAYEN